MEKTNRISVKIIDTLKKISIYSNMHHKHAAALINKNKAVYIGYNKRIHQCFSIHAEVDVLSKLSNKINIKDMDIIVIRVKNDSLMYSRPCNTCINKMTKIGIRKIYYSNAENEIVYEYVKDMEKTHVCGLERSKNRI